MSVVSSSTRKRKVYQCLKCLHRDNKTYVEARYRVYNHFMKKHVSLDAVPFYCRWCLFVAFKKEDLEKHVHSYPRHRAVLRERGMSEEADYLVENRSPYVITNKDVLALSPEESIEHWESTRKTSRRGDLIKETLEATYLDQEPQSIYCQPQTSTQTIPATPESAHVTNFSLAAISPTMPPISNISQYMAPLQELVSLISTVSHPLPGLATHTAGPTADAFNIGLPTPTKEITSTEPAFLSTPVNMPICLNNTILKTPIRIPQDCPEKVDVLSTLPTREECRALRKSASPSISSASSNSSTDSSVTRHNEILSAINHLQSSIQSLNEQYVKQYRSTEHMAQCLLQLSALVAQQPSTTEPQPTKTQQTDNNAQQQPTSEHSSTRQHNYRERSPLRRGSYRRGRKNQDGRPRSPYRGRDRWGHHHHC